MHRAFGHPKVVWSLELPNGHRQILVSQVLVTCTSTGLTPSGLGYDSALAPLAMRNM
jgi:hypothetical protein